MSSESLGEPSTLTQDAPGQTRGKKRKHRGGYNRDARLNHPGVSIVKRRGGFWLKWRIDFRKGVYRYDWQRLPETVTTRKQAERYARRKSNELAAKKYLGKDRRQSDRHLLPVSEGINEYLDHLERERREKDKAFVERTRKAADQQLQRFAAFVEETGIQRCEKLTVDHLRDFRRAMADTGLKNSSINRALDAARAALNYMADEHYLTMDDREIGKALKHYTVTKSEPRILKRAELRRLIKALGTRDAARWKSSREDRSAYYQGRQSDTARPRYRPLVPFVVMALLTGARPGEIESLTGDDVDEEYGVITIRDGKTGGRTIPMHDSPLLRELALSLKLRAKGGKLVGRVKRKLVNQLGLQAGIGITTTTDGDGNEIEKSDLNRQTLRRTCVAHVASGSTDSEYLLASRFGHSTAVSIRHYRQALHGVRERGTTVEAWLGVERELRAMLTNLGYSKADQRTKRQGA